MKQRITLLLLAASLLSCKAQKERVAKGVTEVQIDDYVTSYQEMDIFSGVVLVANSGEVTYAKAFGEANRDTHQKNEVNTLFSIGSMNKTFTDVVIFKLLEQGKLSLEDPLEKYLGQWNQPDFDKITIRHLMNHESGFGDYFIPAYWDLENKNMATILPIIKSLPLHFPPGEDRMYSNAGYVLLGVVIEKVTGKKFVDNVIELIVNPLELEGMVMRNVNQIPNRAIGYMKTVEGVEDNEEFLHEPLPDGGFYATAEDVMRFYRAYFYDKNFLSESLRNQSDFLNQIEPYRNQSDAAIPMAGGFNGSNSVIYERLADNISIVVLANMDEPVAERIGLGIHYMISGKKAPKAILPAKLSVHQAWEKEGVEYVKDNFEKLTENFHPSDPKDLILNGLGYDLLFSGNAIEALEFFKLNTELFPDVANCWDSLGECYVALQEPQKAKEAYLKALELQPDLPSALEAIKSL